MLRPLRTKAQCFSHTSLWESKAFDLKTRPAATYLRLRWHWMLIGTAWWPSIYEWEIISVYSYIHRTTYRRSCPLLRETWPCCERSDLLVLPHLQDILQMVASNLCQSGTEAGSGLRRVANLQASLFILRFIIIVDSKTRLSPQLYRLCLSKWFLIKLEILNTLRVMLFKTIKVLDFKCRHCYY